MIPVSFKTLSSPRLRFFAAATGAQHLLFISRDLIVAYLWGTTEPVGALMSAMILPILLMSLLAYSMNGALLPVYMRFKRSHTKDDICVYASRMLASSVIAFAVVFGLAIVARSHERHAAGLLFYGFLFALCSLPRTLLIAEGKDRAVLLAPIAASVTGLLVLLGTYKFLGVRSLELTYITFALIEFVMLIHFVRRDLYPISLFPLRFYIKEFNELRAQMGFLTAYSLLMSVVLMIDQKIAESFGGSALPHYNYALKIASILSALGQATLNLYLLPRLTASISAKQIGQAQKGLWKYIFFCVAAVLPFCIVLALFSESIVRLLFERGAFLASDTGEVAALQRFMLMQIPSYFVGLLATQILLALKQAKYVFAVGLTNALLRPILSFWISSAIGLVGIGIAAATMHFLVAALLTLLALFYLNREATGGQADDQHRKSA